MASTLTPSFATVQQVSAQENVSVAIPEKIYDTEKIIEGDKENINITSSSDYDYITTFEQDNEKFSIEESLSEDLSKVNTVLYLHDNENKEKIGQMVTINKKDTENNTLDHKQFVDNELLLHEVIDLSVDVDESKSEVIQDNSLSQSKATNSMMRAAAVKYEWRSYPKVSGNNRIARATTASVISILGTIAGAAVGYFSGNAPAGSLVGGSLSSFASTYILSGWNVVYWDKFVQTYHQYNGHVWNQIDAKVQTRFFGDSARRNFVGTVRTK